MPPLRDAHAVRLRHLEIVANREPAHRAALDPLDGDADVVQAHLGHSTEHNQVLARGRKTGAVW